ncbi:MAG: hypothetical protein V2A34_10700 [Lentisphaerota bacterium]
MPQVIFIMLALLLAVLITLLPVRWAARALGARRTGFTWCLLALIGTSILHGLGLMMPVAGSLIAFLLSALGFAAILGTDYIRGVGMAILYLIFSAILIIILAAVFGIGIAGLGML